MRNSKKKGFTIVELVIVIAVIGILSAVLIPTFAGLVNKANQSALQQNLANAYTTYASTYEATDATLYTKEDVIFVDGDVEVAAGGVVTVDDKATIYKFSEKAYSVYTLDTTATYKVVKYTSTGSGAGTTYSADQYNGYYAIVKVV